MNRTRACPGTLTQVEAYLDGELDAAACRAIEHHAAGCAPCAALVQGLRDTIGACRDAGRAPMPESVRQRAFAGVRRLLSESAGQGTAGQKQRARRVKL